MLFSCAILQIFIYMCVCIFVSDQKFNPQIFYVELIIVVEKMCCIVFFFFFLQIPKNRKDEKIYILKQKKKCVPSVK